MYDHRKLGRELGLFDTDPLIGAGLPYWLPDGATVRHTLEEYLRAAERRAGYRHVYSPVLGKRELYEISGHWAHYSDDMFPPMDLGGEQVVLRPSLCPHHALIYQSGPRRLWDEVEAAYRWWDGHDRPGFERFGLTVTAEGQRAWLDTPSNGLVRYR